jgi:hypothetical protein
MLGREGDSGREDFSGQAEFRAMLKELGCNLT